VSHKHSCFSWWWAHSRPKHVDIDKYTKNIYIYTNNKLCTKLVLLTRWTDLSSVGHLVTPVRLKTEIDYVSKYCRFMLENNVKDNLNINNIICWAAASQNKFKLSVFILFFFRKCSIDCPFGKHMCTREMFYVTVSKTCIINTWAEFTVSGWGQVNFMPNSLLLISAPTVKMLIIPTPSCIVMS
jgi:hypothetical protein